MGFTKRPDLAPRGTPAAAAVAGYTEPDSRATARRRARALLRSPTRAGGATRALLGATAAVLLLFAGQARAQTTMLELEGQVDAIQDDAGSLPAEIMLTDPVRFQWSFDSSTMDMNPDPAIGTYDPMNGEVFVEVAGMPLVSCSGMGSLIDILDGDPEMEFENPQLIEQDEYFVTGLGCANLPSGATVELAVLTLADQSEQAIVSDALDQPDLMPPDPAAWDLKEIVVAGCNAGNAGCMDSDWAFTATVLPVPEPAALAQGAGALGALLGLAAARRRLGTRGAAPRA